ncbi:MAG: alpha-glucosidase [Eubacteriales bacterium]|nr:alpha-glucosidase [Eubacteriales bacterium]
MSSQWWRGAVAYQIYPRSFRDANGDGVGDIPGILEKLPYLAELGVTVLWLSPIFVSPMVDNGYDVADYRKLDPVFGVNADLEALVKAAAEYGIRILLDLVINHSSDRHPWFQSAIADAQSPYRDYYVIREGMNGGPPNNWRSFFGGSAWTPLSDGNHYYLHVFAPGQPDLNWENPRLRAEIYDIVHWWMDRGVAGFRIDAASVIKKDQSFADLPPDGEDGMADITGACLVQPGIETFFAELRDKAFKPRNAFTVAEAGGVPDNRLNEFIGPNGYFTTIFDFSYADIDRSTDAWYDYRPDNVALLRNAIFNNQRAILDANGCGAPYLENHDQPRSPSKYLKPRQRTATGKKMLGMLFMFLQGVPFVYQGQELGMTNYPWRRLSQMNDLAVAEQHRLALEAGMTEKEALQTIGRRTRDNARTPMLWQNTAYAGFSMVKPWLPVHPAYARWNVESQRMDSRSVLRFYQAMIALRKTRPELFFRGELVPYGLEQPQLIAYRRVLGGKSVLVACSFSDEPIRLTLPRGKLLLGNRRNAGIRLGGRTTLAPLEGIVLLEEPQV